MSTQVEWMTDLAKAAEDLGYGIVSIDPRRITLVARQTDVEVVIESVMLSGEFLRRTLVPIPHRSGHAYSAGFTDLAKRQ